MSTNHVVSKSMQHRLANDPMLVLNKMASQNGSVNLGLGFPNFPPPNHITQALADAATGENHMLHHYTRPYGHPRLVNILARLYSNLLSISLDPLDHILTTIGAFQGLSSICQSLIHPGDEVILLEPFYSPYRNMLEMRGAVPVFVPLRPYDDGSGQSSANWVFDKAELQNAVTNKTKAIFLNTPMNPLGKVFDREELLEISDLCIKHNLLCVTDEVYEWLIYGRKQHIRIASFPNMWERTVTLGSAGKSFSVTGWKVGWCIGPKHLIKVLQNYHFSSIRTSPTISQEAVAVALEKEMLVLNTPESYFYTLSKDMEGKRNRMCKYLDNAGFQAITPDGGYYIIADISSIQARSVGNEEKTDEALDYRFAKWAVTEKKLCVLPMSIFYSENHRHLCEKYVRICFVKTDETLEKAKEILDDWKQN
ncbi:kynurenine--oxoglutarate transaminase 3-like [Mizuhopecten yessoensis]|nr:kynurenine--oxoglutarate transaminase 3-like [Mizuhopecten yessoensis]XP_021367715.1 kynurenine--oxoglutarate transaminase 3-like [Mizuhopecten yessoensis]XP_021367716.1 kynurenine--oxoglutarate transaminase 3-like [Mizuhopecten yessoensis]XP_021367718.1 kynurenine--oxoglutarate transaminase 3-like [Mizuhopecten yessoensis]